VRYKLFAFRREAYLRYDLGRFDRLVTQKMEAIYSSETSDLTKATQYTVPKEMFGILRISVENGDSVTEVVEHGPTSALLMRTFRI
jgi:hypothetical protein